MTIITKSMITMSQRARLHDRICPPRNVGTGSLLRSPRFARTKWFLPADLAVAHDPAETESSRGSRRVFTGHVRREEDGPAVLLQVRSSGCVTAGDRLVVGAGNPPSNAPFDDPALTMPRRRHAAEQHAPLDANEWQEDH